MRADILEVLLAYQEIIHTSKFHNHWLTLSNVIHNAILDNIKTKREEEIVRTLVDEINKNDKLKATSGFLYSLNGNYEIRTYGVFIHGNRLNVKFICCDNYKRIELGDVIFILSVRYNGAIYFQKISINQVKKQSSNIPSDRIVFSFYGNSLYQLYLLSHFPKFDIVSGGKGSFRLIQTVGLGSFGLLNNRTGFYFIDSNLLELFMRKKTLSSPCRVKTKKMFTWDDLLEFLSNLFEDYNDCDAHHRYWFQDNEVWYDLKNLIYFMLRHFLLNRIRSSYYFWEYRSILDVPLLVSYTHLPSTYSFVLKYLSGQVGNLSYHPYLIDETKKCIDIPFKLFISMVKNWEKKGKRKHEKLMDDMLDFFLNSRYLSITKDHREKFMTFNEIYDELFSMNSRSNDPNDPEDPPDDPDYNEGEGIAIIHTIIDIHRERREL